MGENINRWLAGKCLQQVRHAIEFSEFGYRIQGLAAHVLLRLGARVLQINSQGHPDIVAETERGFIRFEVEADLHGARARIPTEEDLDGIAPRGVTDKGYFALALCGPYPRWFLVDYIHLRRRHGNPASPAIIQAISDAQVSEQWTTEFIALILAHRQHLQVYSFDFLVRRALEGKPL
jgi:hypothetical protein